ncbi:MAG TPA: (2Fe-2S)-binding protein [Stenotrophobium sp.]|jgi:bacterioferritin-associated ferredoxin|nr:(2Fe-2S)-binding protein [Stenotrophobium sp.]
MIVCVCKSVSDQRIRRLVAQGEVITLRDLMRETGLGTCCGSCVPEARAVLASALSQQPAPPLLCAPQNAGLGLPG